MFLEVVSLPLPLLRLRPLQRFDFRQQRLAALAAPLDRRTQDPVVRDVAQVRSDLVNPLGIRLDLIGGYDRLDLGGQGVKLSDDLSEPVVDASVMIRRSCHGKFPFLLAVRPAAVNRSPRAGRFASGRNARPAESPALPLSGKRR